MERFFVGKSGLLRYAQPLVIDVVDIEILQRDAGKWQAAAAAAGSAVL